MIPDCDDFITSIRKRLSAASELKVSSAHSKVFSASWGYLGPPILGLTTNNFYTYSAFGVTLNNFYAVAYHVWVVSGNKQWILRAQYASTSCSDQFAFPANISFARTA
uniref:Uncharacterized protein n=1 Tax=Trichobilharzia regenti TaxID=157069 RepID=A0AA85JXV9_TRIRE|nr:unnamed protein product [Trichobilharzia regenti]